ncbi:hypothetical protein [Scytonema sp. HK-05]|uniref:hypothetical protein n=1 Tax=Scytonema sp. HK-05 TaxID=1137095 RepID=UPI001301036D|nr:hypothetical protein [Scytonema sp. HK-05]
MPSGYGHGYRLYRASSGGGTARLTANSSRLLSGNPPKGAASPFTHSAKSPHNQPFDF